MAKKKSFRSAPRIVSGRESDRCTLLIRLVSAMCFSPGSCVIQLPGKSQARKFTAAMAMPTPKSTPASTRFEPPSPKAKVRPATTMATSERPRAMVLVKAVIKTLTAFSQGEVPCANAGAARSSVKPRVTRGERSQEVRRYFERNRFMFGLSLSRPSFGKGPLRGSPRLQQQEGDRWRLLGRLYALGPGLPLVQAHLERFAPSTA